MNDSEMDINLGELAKIRQNTVLYAALSKLAAAIKALYVAECSPILAQIAHIDRKDPPILELSRKATKAIDLGIAAYIIHNLHTAVSNVSLSGLDVATLP